MAKIEMRNSNNKKGGGITPKSVLKALIVLGFLYLIFALLSTGIRALRSSYNFFSRHSNVVNPFYILYLNQSPSLNGTRSAISVGIASYGMYSNLDANDIAYDVNTNEIVGIANITELGAYDAAPPGNSSKFGASLQLNIVMTAQQGNVLRVYWLQNVPSFETSNKLFSIQDEIFNISSAGAAPVTPGSLIGRGSVSTFNSTVRPTYTYAYPSSGNGSYLMGYALPLSIKLITSLHETRNDVVVSFGYQILRNDYCAQQLWSCNNTIYSMNDTPGRAIFYDNVTIFNTSNATILVTPRMKTPRENYYDAELVFGGESSGESTTFTSMNAKLDLLYNKNGTLVTFPSYFTFGHDTMEGTFNLDSSIINGSAYVGIGPLNPLSSITTHHNLTSLMNSYSMLP